MAITRMPFFQGPLAGAEWSADRRRSTLAEQRPDRVLQFGLRSRAIRGSARVKQSVEARHGRTAANSAQLGVHQWGCPRCGDDGFHLP